MNTSLTPMKNICGKNIKHPFQSDFISFIIENEVTVNVIDYKKNTICSSARFLKSNKTFSMISLLAARN